MDLSPEQQGLKTSITTGAVITGVIVGLVVALLAFWLAGSLADIWRWLLTLVLGGGAGFLTYRLRYNSGVAKAVCPKCGTAFGIREVEKHEEVIGIEQKRKIEPIKPADKMGRGASKVTTWTEEKLEVTAIDECFKCHNRTERKWQTTRDKDKTETEVPA
jgi:DNA-directed RNA polymerase subunit M/transcription elongation factor TFIIS